MLFLLTFPLFHVATSFHVQNVSSIGTRTLWVTSIFCRSYVARFIPCPAKGQGMAVAGRYAFIIGVVEAFYQTLGGNSSFKVCNLRRVTMVRWHSFPMLAHTFESIDSPQHRGWCSVGQMGAANAPTVSTQDDCGAGHLRGIAQSLGREGSDVVRTAAQPSAHRRQPIGLGIFGPCQNKIRQAFILVFRSLDKL